MLTKANVIRGSILGALLAASLLGPAAEEKHDGKPSLSMIGPSIARAQSGGVVGEAHLYKRRSSRDRWQFHGRYRGTHYPSTGRFVSASLSRAAQQLRRQGYQVAASSQRSLVPMGTSYWRISNGKKFTITRTSRGISIGYDHDGVGFQSASYSGDTISGSWQNRLGTKGYLRGKLIHGGRQIVGTWTTLPGGSSPPGTSKFYATRYR